MKLGAFAWRNARREWHAGELSMLAGAVIVAVAAMTAVNTFANRIERAMAASANDLLAADLVVQSRAPLDAGWEQEASERGLRTAIATIFPSVVFYGDESQLAAVKTVTDSYPLRGELTLTDTPFGKGIPVSAAPPQGEVWVDSRLAAALGAPIGAKLEVGRLSLELTSIIALEPDRQGDLFNLGPRLMFNDADLAASELLGPASRASYRLMLAGNEEQLEDFKTWLEPQMEGQRFTTIRDTQQQLRAALERADRFLSLAALSAVLLSGIAIVMAARRFSQRHYDSVAILRCLGAKRSDSVTAFMLQLFIVGLPAAAIGTAIGFAAQSVLANILSGLVVGELPAPGLKPALQGIVTGLIMLLGFALPPLARLRQITPLRVLRRDLGPVAQSDRLTATIPFIAAGALLLWQARDLTLGLYLLGGTALAALAMGGLALGVIRLLRALGKRAGFAWRFGVANVARRAASSVVQISGLGLGLMVVLLLSVVRGQLLDDWQASLPEDTPNFFLINIQPEQLNGTQEHLRSLGLETTKLYPMAVSKLSGINGRLPDADEFEDPRAQRRLNGTVNVSWSSELPPGNRIIDGEWFDVTDDLDEASIAESWASVLNVGVGDTLSFTVGEVERTVTVANIREVEWDSFHVNFFILLEPGPFDDVARSYLSSFYLSKASSAELADLARQYPNISILDVDDLLTKVRDIIGQVTYAVEFVFIFTLIAGLVVILAALRSTQDERVYESAILRTVGAAAQKLRLGVLAEFSVLGLVAGGLAGVAAILIGGVLATQVFNSVYQPNYWLLLIGLAVGVITTCTVGLSGNRQVVNASPLITLRRF